VCPPLPSGERPVDPDWCKPIHQAGGVWPIVGVAVFAVLVVAAGYFLVRRRPSSERGFLILTVVAYLMAGLVSVTIGNAFIGVSLRDMVADPSYLLQIPLWPLFVFSYLGGGYGR
jgi:hypothetical protein